MELRKPTQIQLNENQRSSLVKGLNTALGSTIDLALQVKQAHWNIRGPQFFARHELFDKVAGHLFDLSDKLAERAGTVGGYAEGTVRLSSQGSVLPEYNLKAREGRDHIVALTERYGTYTKMLRERLHELSEIDDPATEDLYVESLRTAELDLWFLESHVAS